jgi:hypothetical protein
MSSKALFYPFPALDCRILRLRFYRRHSCRVVTGFAGLKYDTEVANGRPLNDPVQCDLASLTVPRG